MKLAVFLAALCALPTFGFSDFGFRHGLLIEENRGQAAGTAQYLARGDGFTVGFSANDVVFSRKSGSSLALSFTDETADARWEALDPLPSTSNYVLGNDSHSWIRNIPHFARIRRRGVYPG